MRRRTRSSHAYRSRSLSAAEARRAAAVSAPGGTGEAGSTDEGNCPIKEVGGCSKASAVFECAHRHLRKGAAQAQPRAHLQARSGPRAHREAALAASCSISSRCCANDLWRGELGEASVPTMPGGLRAGSSKNWAKSSEEGSCGTKRLLKKSVESSPRMR